MAARLLQERANEAQRRGIAASAAKRAEKAKAARLSKLQSKGEGGVAPEAAL